MVGSVAIAGDDPTPRLRVPADSAVGALIAALDDTTPLGPPTRWPATLVRTVNLLLPARSEIVLFWGADYIAFYNDDYARTIGIKHPQALGRPARENWAELWDDLAPMLDRVRVDGETISAKDRAFYIERSGHGEEVYFDISYSPVRDDAGAIAGVLCLVSDTTERVRAQAQLLLSRSSLELAAEMAEIGTWDLDLATDTLQWSDRTRAMFGISPGVPVSMRDFYAGLHPDDAAQTEAAFAAALDPERRATYDVEYRTIGKEDGVVRWIAAKGRGMFDAETGQCVRALGTTLDITQRRQQQEELRESEARFRTIADSAPALIWTCDAHGALVFANRWHEETFGRPVAALLGEGWQAILHPDDRAAYVRDFAEAFANRAAFSRDVRVIDRDGRERWLHCEARARHVDGCFVGYAGCDVDITDVHLVSEMLERGIAERTQELAATNRQLSAQIEERERVEATLRQMQRLEAIGQLTSGVAHDFNNLLTVVLGNVDLVARAAQEAGLDERTRKRLGYMRTAAERGATLTAQLLAFSRRQRLEARPIDLNDTVAGMRDLLQSSMGGSVRLETRLRPDLWPALVDPTQIELIILNLAINARDAMEVGGALAVETDNIVLGEPERPEEPPPGDYVLIAVTDTGSGMTPEVRDRAFEPFFTTKPIGKGSGLGLPQVYGFAKQSGGGVAIETEVGRGTSVRVYLPRAEERRRTPRTPTIEAPPEQPGDVRGRRVLVVDDDPPVREITATMLRAMGAEVIEAGSGGAALEWLDQAGARCDLMVVDFAMPGMNGAELAAVVRTRWPRIPVLFATGYADLSAIASVSEDRIVQKPFRGGELQRKVVRLLASRAG
jgi:PAS domain S-box-containing protein